MNNWFVVSLLFLLPLVIFPYGSSYFEVPKVLLGQILIEAAFLYLFFRSGYKLKNIDKRFLFLVGIIAFISLTHLFVTPTATVFWGNQFRLQGTFLLWHLIIFSLLCSVSSSDKFSKWVPILAFLGLFLSIFLLGLDPNGRAVGTLGEPNSLAAAALFIWPFIYFSLKGDRIKLLYKAILLTAALIIIIFSGSRSALLGFVLQLLFLILVSRLSVKISVVGVIVLLLASLTLPFLEDTGLFENRSDVWRISALTAIKNPALGFGFGNAEHYIRATAQEVNSNIQYQYVDSAHNVLLDYLIQGGVPGLLALVVLIFLSVRNFVAQRRILEVTLLLGVFTVMLFNPVSVVILLYFWWIIAQGFRPSNFS